MQLVRRFLLSLAAVALVVVGSAQPSSAETTALPSLTTSASAALQDVDNSSARKLRGCSEDWYKDDRRLGPKTLSNQGLTGLELIGYKRTGNLSPEQFLKTYWDDTINDGQGGWTYPEDDGFLNDAKGDPIKWTQRLTPGMYIDRYGSEYGSFLAPAGIPYSSRSIPPSSLVGTPAANCNYSNYRVVKTFDVSAGPIAPWFGQPGYGLQYQLKSELVPGAPAQLNVLWLVEAGYLERVPATIPWPWAGN